MYNKIKLLEQNNLYGKVIYYALILVIICLSFFFYSSNFYPLLNSDDALNILMAHYYKLPHDLYCWGQDRGGTFIPLISQIFIKLFRFSALTSVSLANYLVLIIGFIGFSSLFKTKFTKIAFAIIWFLPFQRFIDLLRFPIGVEYSLIGITIFLINKLDLNNPNKILKNNLILFTITLTLILTVWISDIAVVSIFILLCMILLYYLINEKPLKINKFTIGYFVIGTIICYFSIKYAKSTAFTKTHNYLSINNLSELKKSLIFLKEAWIKVYSFNTHELLVSIYAYSVTLFLFLVIGLSIKSRSLISLLSNKWVGFFTLDFLIIFIVLLFSSWVLANEMGRWYFVASYISLSLAVLLVIEIINLRKHQIAFLKIFLLFVVLIGAASPIYTMKHSGTKSLKPMVKVVGEFKQLGKIGIIAEFWNSYIASCPDPDMIKATPHDHSNVRNMDIANMVLNQDKIYVIRDLWMKSFPDTLKQFGYVLVKDGNEFKMGRCKVCKYNKLNP